MPSVASWERRLVRRLVALDTFIIAIAVCGGFFVRFETGSTASTNALFALLIGPIWMALIAASGGYERDRIRTGAEQAKAVCEASIRASAITALSAFILDVQVSRGFYSLTLVGGFVVLLAGRWAAQNILHRARARGRCLHRVVAVGTVDDITHLLAQIDRKAHHGLTVVGACSTTATENIGNVPVLGTPAETRRIAAEVQADTVAVTSTGVLGREGLRRLAWDFEGSDTSLLLTPELTDVAGPRINVRPLGALSLLEVSEPTFSGTSKLIKDAYDRLFAVVGLVVLLPVMATIALCIKLDSRGPVFFRQKRTGAHGRPFTLVKFRSMVPAAEEMLIDLTDENEGGAVLFKIRRDPRVTRVGRVLRRYSLDELPQLLNVLAGDMSLVGPRPPLPSEVELYPSDVRRRLLVKPGLTGLWQVNGRSDLTWEESVRLDLYYVDNWSLLLDFLILGKTATAVVAGRGAY